jgi:hypothetical protein
MFLYGNHVHGEQVKVNCSPRLRNYTGKMHNNAQFRLMDKDKNVGRISAC